MRIYLPALLVAAMNVACRTREEPITDAGLGGADLGAAEAGLDTRMMMDAATPDSGAIGSLGAACMDNQQCADDETCETALPNRACTRACGEANPCPPDFVCYAMPGGASECLRSCTHGGAPICRDRYGCSIAGDAMRPSACLARRLHRRERLRPWRVRSHGPQRRRETLPR